MSIPKFKKQFNYKNNKKPETKNLGLLTCESKECKACIVLPLSNMWYLVVPHNEDNVITHYVIKFSCVWQLRSFVWNCSVLLDLPSGQEFKVVRGNCKPSWEDPINIDGSRIHAEISITTDDPEFSDNLNMVCPLMTLFSATYSPNYITAVIVAIKGKYCRFSIWVTKDITNECALEIAQNMKQILTTVDPNITINKQKHGESFESQTRLI